jgi:hypothetical protein
MMFISDHGKQVKWWVVVIIDEGFKPSRSSDG